MRRWIVLLLILAGLVVALIGGVAAYALTADIGPWLLPHVARLAGRPVELRSLHVALGRNALHLSATGVRVPAPDPALPDLLRAARADAVLELWPLLRLHVVARSLDLDGAVLTLARDKDGVGNWATSRTQPRPTQPSPPPTLPPLLDVRLHNSELVSIGSSGKPFRVGLQDALIHTTGPADPVVLDATGTLAGVPVVLHGDLGSFDALRSRPNPFPMKLLLTSGRSTLRFEGTAANPLEFDGLDGAAALDVPALAELLAAMRVANPPQLALRLAGHLVAAGGDWRLHEATGALDKDGFKGDLRLVEGGRGAPDAISGTLSFATLDAGHLASQAGDSGDGPPSLPVIEADPDPLLDLRLAATRLTYRSLVLTELETHVIQDRSQVALPETSFRLGGGKVSGGVKLVAEAGATRATGAVTVAGVDLRQAFRAAGLGQPPVSGPAAAEVLVDITGRELQAALARGRVTLAVSMAGGSIARNLVRQASIDLGSLFGNDTAQTRLACLLAVVDVKNGAGVVGPVRLETADGDIDGWGELDARRATVDMTLQSNARTTGALALDIPVRITGPIANPRAAPSLDAMRRRFGPARLGPWPADIVRFMRGSACLRTGQGR